MNILDITDELLSASTTVALRKLARELGIKGMSSARGGDLRTAIKQARTAEQQRLDAEQAERDLAEQDTTERDEHMNAVEAEAAPSKPKSSPKMCNVCGKRRPYTGGAGTEKAPHGSGMCNYCAEEGGWENAHSDRSHDAIRAEVKGNGDLSEQDRAEYEQFMADCWICHPEKNLATRERNSATGVNRQGQVVVAKGDKIKVFKEAAEAAGYQVAHDDTSYGYDTLTASNGTKVIEIVWFNSAYLYGPSFIEQGGKRRKVRNLKEALRLI